MSEYNYYDAVREDINNYIDDNIGYYIGDVSDLNELEGRLYDDLFIEDSVTGNGSGSYTFSSWQAEENIAHNLDLLTEALDSFGCDFNNLNGDAESADVTIRCYLLGQVLGEVIREREEELQ